MGKHEKKYFARNSFADYLKTDTRTSYECQGFKQVKRYSERTIRNEVTVLKTIVRKTRKYINSRVYYEDAV